MHINRENSKIKEKIITSMAIARKQTQKRSIKKIKKGIWPTKDYDQID